MNRRPVGLIATAVALLLTGRRKELCLQRRVGQLRRQWPAQPAIGEPLQGRRTVDDATPTRRAISFPGTPAAFNRSTARTWRIAILSAGMSPPAAKAKGADAKRPAETPSRRATSLGISSQGSEHLMAALPGGAVEEATFLWVIPRASGRDGG